MTRVVVLGDVLLDRDLVGDVERVCPDAPVPVVEIRESRARPGGAGLAAVLLAADRCAVTLISALGDDDAGDELRTLLAGHGVELVDVGSAAPTPEKIRVRSGGQSLVRLDRGERSSTGAIGALGSQGRRALADADAILVADYGRGMAAQADVRTALAERPNRSALVWDPHPHGAPPVRGTHLATPNLVEAGRFTGAPATTSGAIGEAARLADALLERWPVDALALTLGSRGALLARRGAACHAVPSPTIAVGDSCGAGDRFAGATALALAQGAILPEAVEAAVAAASAFVAAGGASALGGEARVTAEPAGRAGASRSFGTVERVRAGGGSVVATGGCFDLLHAGHVAMLQAARSLGDCLVVLVNSDASVRRLKGPDRPLQRVEDRCEVLAALGCVDEVVVFEEDTPVAALERLRPDVWVKGGDYTVDDLPEAETVSGWGGRAVVVPYLAGRSTTRLFQEVATRVRS